MANYYRFSPKEMELMELFWAEGRPLTRGEVLECAEERPCTWKPNSIHILVNSLMEKGALRVAGYYQNSHKLGRIFEPVVSLAGYYLQLLEGVAEQAFRAGVDPDEAFQALSTARENIRKESSAPGDHDV